jgi:hypothetical protein
LFFSCSIAVKAFGDNSEESALPTKSAVEVNIPKDLSFELAFSELEI